MTFDELLNKLLPILPECTFGEECDGQLIIYTNLREDDNGNLVRFEDACTWIAATAALSNLTYKKGTT